jgi:hypothetical protein
MKKHYLMIKTNLNTKLKYLCKKTTDNIQTCYSYKGSGKYWLRHLAIHGSDISTEIIEICDTKEQLIERGIYWSKLLNVVNSEEYANLVEERGDGGPTMLGRQITKEQKKKQGKAISNFWKNSSEEYKRQRNLINKQSHEIYEYHTPNGIFRNGHDAAAANNCTNVTIMNRCRKDVDKPILSRKYWKFGWKGMTWRQLGWSCVLLDR